MRFILEEDDMSEYLMATKYVDYHTPCIEKKAAELFADCKTDAEKVKKAFLFVRDEISHSWDIKSSIITKNASEVLTYKEGICYAKSMLLAALLRHEGIPTAFCYQRLTVFDMPDSGYCIHCLNAVYLKDLNRWVRLDARGNTNGSHSEFSLDEEHLAFPVRKEYDEIDFPTLFAHPLKNTTDALEQSENCEHLIRHHLPTNL